MSVMANKKMSEKAKQALRCKLERELHYAALEYTEAAGGFVGYFDIKEYHARQMDLMNAAKAFGIFMLQGKR
jgi:hypothetical protein